MRAGLFLLAWGLLAQPPGPAFEPLAKAYEALRSRQYETAISFFLRAIEAVPAQPSIRKDLAYTYLKIGENDAAREQFREAMRLDPADSHVALEYAFLCYEGKEKADARRIFDRVRRAGDAESRATAEEAFRNVDGPLAAGIARWQEAIRRGGPSFSSHYELARMAEQQDELALAAEHYEKAWRLKPERRSVLVDLGRVWGGLKRGEQANAAVLAASRGGEARAAESARELLPARYPYENEFRAALALDPANVQLRRELGYLLLRMNRQAEAEAEFWIITERDEQDLLSAAQLGFLYLGRGDRQSAMPLLERVLRGGDQELANRVRAVLRIPQSLHSRDGDATRPQSHDAREMADRSLRAGYIKDALRYLEAAHEADPADGEIILKLAWAHNLLKQDSTAVRWFDLARKNPDGRVAAEASRAYRNLKTGIGRMRTSMWLLPFYSSRWRDAFAYGQLRSEMQLNTPVRPYASIRFAGNSRGSVKGTGVPPQYLSESAVITGVGLATRTWHGVTGWAEAGAAFGYLAGHVTPDYRAGASYFRGFGRGLGSERPGWFAETGADALYASRFDHDVLFYGQNRAGITAGPRTLSLQIHLNANVTADTKRQAWANYVEAGPGLRFRWTALPESLHFNVNVLRGAYLRDADLRRPNFTDVRAGVAYAIRF